MFQAKAGHDGSCIHVGVAKPCDTWPHLQRLSLEHHSDVMHADAPWAEYPAQTTTLTQPEELERVRAERRRGAAVVNALEISDQVVAAADALEVAWKPPTKNCERLAGYKARCQPLPVLPCCYDLLCDVMQLDTDMPSQRSNRHSL